MVTFTLSSIQLFTYWQPARPRAHFQTGEPARPQIRFCMRLNPSVRKLHEAEPVVPCCSLFHFFAICHSTALVNKQQHHGLWFCLSLFLFLFWWWRCTQQHTDRAHIDGTAVRWWQHSQQWLQWLQWTTSSNSTSPFITSSSIEETRVLRPVHSHLPAWAKNMLSGHERKGTLSHSILPLLEKLSGNGLPRFLLSQWKMLERPHTLPRQGWPWIGKVEVAKWGKKFENPGNWQSKHPKLRMVYSQLLSARFTPGVTCSILPFLGRVPITSPCMPVWISFCMGQNKSLCLWMMEVSLFHLYLFNCLHYSLLCFNVFAFM